MPRSAGRRAATVIAAVLAAALLTSCGSSAPPTATPQRYVMDAPVEVAHTSDGAVGYRSIGSGPALVLIMGYVGTMENWDPYFVDTLARHFRVVTFDNAGVGATSRPKGALSIDAMAEQTSALMRTLKLGRADVLGWSMGGLIAQALAVLHPKQVKALVLCATFPGDGSAVVPSQADVAALTGSSAAAEAELFPAGQTLAAQAFSGSLGAYPKAPPASASIAAAQRLAVDAWFSGTDPAGRRADSISVPTLIADGRQDHLVATANARSLHQLIAHSRLLLYPDSGHAFLFQEGVVFTHVVATFFLGAATPAGSKEFRHVFTTADASAKSAATTWAATVKSLDASSDPRALSRANVTLADASGAFLDTLLDLGATGTRGALVEAFVVAQSRELRDVLALGDQTKTSLKSWTAATERDNARSLAAYNALRANLGLAPVNPTTTTPTTTTSLVVPY